MRTAAIVSSSLVMMMMMLLLLLNLSDAFAPSCRQQTVATAGTQHQQQPFRRTSCFAPRRRHALYATTTPSQQESTTVEEETLSDLDTRILQSMLQEDSKLSLDTEDGIRQLLERGTTGKPKSTATSNDIDDDQSKYSSTVVKTFADTRLWRKLSAQADDLLGSLQLWVSNKVEQDLRVVAALGLFAWDRVQRDVARALPERRTQNSPLLLTNSSSYDASSSRSARDDLMRPSDEIRSVTRTIRDILSGQSKSDSRSLRTAAPAGTARVADRQRRAYQQQTKQRRQQADVTRLPRQAMDAAWELRRELQSESSRPGYKTQPLRTALQQGVAQTSQYLRSAARQQRQLQASRKAVARLQQAQEAVAATQATLVEQVVQERAELLQRLKDCIETPEQTWLSDQAVAEAAVEDGNLKLDSDGLQQVVTMMIEIRDSVEMDDSHPSISFDDRIQDLMALRHRIAGLHDRTATVVSATIAETLANEILGVDQMLDVDDDDEEAVQPVMLRLEELQESYDKLSSTRTEVDREYAGLESSLNDLEESVADFEAMAGHDAAVDNGDKHGSNWFAAEFDDGQEIATRPTETGGMPNYVDVIPERLHSAEKYPYFAAELILENDTEPLRSSPMGFVAEIVTDEDFDAAFGQAKVASAVESEDDVEDKTNLLVDLSLRALDIAFYVLEKTFTVVIPNTLRIGQTVSERIQEMQNTKNGSPGWERMRNVVDAKGRY